MIRRPRRIQVRGARSYSPGMAEVSDPLPIVLLTGFGPFPGVSNNASADVVRGVSRLAFRTFPEVRFVTAILPTEWRRAPRLVADLHQNLRPALALHFGVASGTSSIRLETKARNVCRPSLDAAGALPLAEMLCDGPDARPVTIDVPAIAGSLKAGGWPCSLSDDAGGYLCNAVLYQSLSEADALGNCKVGFVHIPAELSGPLSPDNVVAAAAEILNTAVRAVAAGTNPA